MDRLLCGDVGYGKTEVAMRAAFKVVMEGKQVAFLAPTTILAFQHLRTIKERFAVSRSRDMISRFRTKAEQKSVSSTSPPASSTSSSARIGCCRRTSRSAISGCSSWTKSSASASPHKERIKQMRRKVDVLTMTATPIPRTLNMSLAGIRDMSVIETPPRDRCRSRRRSSSSIPMPIARAVRTELERGGQVFLVHNRVESIHSIASLVTRWYRKPK
jgi:transcription-repair coupling factor (superfamily II helicase)